MPAGSIFESEEKTGSNSKTIVIAVAAFLVLAAAGYLAYWISSPPPPDLDAINAAEIRESMVFLLAQPSFSGEELREQLLGKGRIAKYKWREKEVYFTYPETDEGDFQEFLSQHITDLSKVDF